MKSYGIPSKLFRMVNVMYDDNQCAVVDGTGRTDWFDVNPAVKQGCHMSGFLSLLVIDGIMRTVTSSTTLELDENFGPSWTTWILLMTLHLHPVKIIKSNRK